jgi:NAD(P)-dependent dehydrogenase (short-subunit alcohol dehydrogenase family)
MRRFLTPRAGGAALIAGGGGSTGAALVELAVARGHVPLVADLDLDAARAIAARHGGLALGLDVRDPAMWANALANAAAQAGGLALMINVARARPAPETRDEAAAENIRLIMETNFFGATLGAEAARATMAANGGGAIVHRVGAEAWAGFQGRPGEAAAAHALRAWHLSSAARFAQAGVRTTLLGVGPFKPGAPAPSPREVAAAAFWAVDRRKSIFLTPDDWAARRLRVRGALAEVGPAAPDRAALDPAREK